jgi:probable rRNA maturation factor
MYPMGSRFLTLLIHWEEPRWRNQISFQKCQQVIQQTLQNLQWSRPVEISISFVNDLRMTQINQLHRGFFNPTNVLSFPAFEKEFWFSDKLDQFPHLTLGDLILSFDTINREVQNEGKGFVEHASHLIVHGVLHLLGYDHNLSQEASVMEQIEIRILKELNISNPYECKPSVS